VPDPVNDAVLPKDEFADVVSSQLWHDAAGLGKCLQAFCGVEQALGHEAAVLT